MLSFDLSINVIIIVVSFKILDLCPIALFQQLWNTLYLGLWAKRSTQRMDVWWELTGGGYCFLIGDNENLGDSWKWSYCWRFDFLCEGVHKPIKDFSKRRIWRFWFPREQECSGVGTRGTSGAARNKPGKTGRKDTEHQRKCFSCSKAWTRVWNFKLREKFVDHAPPNMVGCVGFTVG